MATLTDLIQNMIKTNEETQKELQKTQSDFKDLENIVETQTSDTHLVELMQESLVKSDYFISEKFFTDIGEALIDKYGLGELIKLDNKQLNEAVTLYLSKNLDTQGIVNYILKDYSEEIREAMIRRIRIESKSIIDNYDFSIQVVPRLQEIFNEFMKKYELTNYLIESTTKLFVAQESNLAFMLEYILSKEFLTPPYIKTQG